MSEGSSPRGYPALDGWVRTGHMSDEVKQSLLLIGLFVLVDGVVLGLGMLPGALFG
jgi:hypothetical protein